MKKNPLIIASKILDEEGWRTISGAKVHINEEGKIDGGAGGKFSGKKMGEDWHAGERSALMQAAGYLNAPAEIKTKAETKHISAPTIYTEFFNVKKINEQIKEYGDNLSNREREELGYLENFKTIAESCNKKGISPNDIIKTCRGYEFPFGGVAWHDIMYNKAACEYLTKLLNSEQPYTAQELYDKLCEGDKKGGNRKIYTRPDIDRIQTKQDFNDRYGDRDEWGNPD